MLFRSTDESIPALFNNDTLGVTSGDPRGADNNSDQQTHDSKLIRALTIQPTVQEVIDGAPRRGFEQYSYDFIWKGVTYNWFDVPFRVYKKYMLSAVEIGGTTTDVNWNLSYDNSLYIPLSAPVQIPEVDID